LALGGRASLTKLIDEQQRGSSLTADPQYTAAPLPEPLRQKTAAWFSYSSVELEAAQMMGALVRLSGVGHHGAPEDLSQRLDRLPLAVSATAVRERGLYIESRSPLGNFPLFVAVVDSSISKNE